VDVDERPGGGVASPPRRVRSRPRTAVARSPLPYRFGRDVRAALAAGYVFFLPVQLPLGADRRLAISDLFILAYLLFTMFRLRRMSACWSSWYPLMLALMGMGLLVALIQEGSVSQFAITQKAFGLAFLMVTFACLVDFMRSLRDIRWLLDVFIAGVAVNVAIALAAYVVQQGHPERLPVINYLGVRLSGFIIDPNAFGGLVACALVLHIFADRPTPFGLSSPWQDVLSGGFGIALVLTFSRSAWIAAGLGILVAVAAGGRSAGRAILPLLVTLVVAVPLLAFKYLPDLSSLADRQDQVQGRLSIISSSLSDFTHDPVLGIGLGSFFNRHGVIIHNTLFWFLCEMGVVGVVVLIGFFSSAILRLVELARDGIAEVRTLAVSLLAANAAMIGLSLGIEALYQRQWWLLLAAGGALRGISNADGR
jgi:putative inorganic carbon (HCO3(-)) transporter